MPIENDPPAYDPFEPTRLLDARPASSEIPTRIANDTDAPTPHETPMSPPEGAPTQAPGSPDDHPPGTMMGSGSAIPSLPSRSTAAAVRLPGYEILEELGRGGMGVVYRARQISVNRVVALKMMLAGFGASGDAVRRFKLEAELIGAIQHPNIVQIHEVGDIDGQPWFSLEYCEGGSLHARMKGRVFGSHDAARVIETLALAMGAAHRVGIVHRDLKPANILVRSDNTQRGNFVLPNPAATSTNTARLPDKSTGAKADGTSSLADNLILKITDFGLARDLASDDGMTRTGEIMGTPGYMAPEQAVGSREAIGPGTDIYALGAMLYELLTGRPPFRGASVMETLDQVRNQEPVAIRLLQAGTPRDIETVCLKCLRKDPDKRYASADELAADLRRFQEDKPILARPVGSVETAWRWCRRNPGVSSLVGILATVLMVGFVGMAILRDRAESAAEDAIRLQKVAQDQSDIATRERLEAEEQKKLAVVASTVAEERRKEAETQKAKAVLEAENARQIAGFLGSLFESADPIGINQSLGFLTGHGGQTLTARELLENGANRIESDKTMPVEVRMQLRQKIAQVCLVTGAFERAREMLESLIPEQKRLLGEDHADVARSLHSLGWYFQMMGDYAKARGYYEQAIAVRQKLVPLPEADLADSQFNLGWLLLEAEDLPEARRLLTASLEIRTRLFTRSHRLTAYSQIALAAACIEQGQYLEGVALSKAAVTVFGEIDPTGRMSKAAGLFQDAVFDGFMSKRYEDSVAKLKKADEYIVDMLGPTHGYRGLFLYQIAYFLVELDRDAEALEYYRRTHDIVRKNNLLTHPKAVILVENYAATLRYLKKPDEADAMIDEWLAAHRARKGNLFYPDALVVYANYLKNEKDRKDTIPILEEAAGIFRTQKATPRLYRLRCLANLGWAYLRAGRPAECETVVREWLVAYATRGDERREARLDAVYLLSASILNQNRSGSEVLDFLEKVRSAWKPTFISKAHKDYVWACANFSRAHRYLERPEAGIQAARDTRKASSIAQEFWTAARELAGQAQLLRDGTPSAEWTALAKTLDGEALAALTQAVEKGYRNRELTQAEPCFSHLRDAPDFEALVAKMVPQAKANP